MKKCVSCGRVQEEENRFCTGCGGQNFTPVKQEKKKKPWLIILCVLVAAALVAVGAYLMLFDPVGDFEEALQAGNFDTAMEVLEEHITDDPERRDEAFYRFGLWLEELYRRYEQEEITYEDLITQLEELERFGIHRDRIYQIYSNAGWLNYLRQTYSFAEQAMANGDYLEAYDLYNEVSGMDFENGQEAPRKAAEALEAYWQQILAQVNDYLENDQYERAYSLLDEVYYQIPDDGRVSAAYDMVYIAQAEYEMDQTLATAAVYMQQHDFVGALACLDESMGRWPDETRIMDYRDQCLKEFESYVLSESLRLAQAGDFDRALFLIEFSSDYFTSPELTELALIYASHIPIHLGDMEIFENKTKGGSWVTYTNEKDKYLEDNYSNCYEHSLSVGCGSLTYLVNFKYQTLRGTVAFPKGLESDNARKSASLYIYGDGEEIAKFLNFTSSSKPEKFEIDITGYERITLKWKCEGYNIWEDWGYFATIFEGLFIPIPLELPA